MAAWLSSALARQRQEGLTLMEMLSALAIFSLVVALAAHTVGNSRHRLDTGAARRVLMEAFQQAHLQARVDRVRTRVVFSPDWSGLPRMSDGPPERSLAVYVLVVPRGATAAPQWMRSTEQIEGTARPEVLEPLLLTVPALPEALTAQWVIRSPTPRWQVLPEGTRLESPLFERFARMAGEVFARENYAMPATVWAPEPAPGREPSSVYPPDYQAVPYPSVARLVSRPLDPAATVYDRIRQQTVPARNYWPEDVVLEQLDPPLSRQSPAWELPAVEFDESGRPVFSWTRSLEFRLSNEREPSLSETLLVDGGNGLIRSQEVRP